MKTVLSILLLCSVSVQPLFGFTVLSLPNVKRDHWVFSKDSISTPEEMESKARENETEIRRFKELEKTKADRALIEATVSLLKPFHLDEIEAILGTRQPIPENHLLPAVFHYGGLTVSAHQDAGESTAAFFPSATSAASTSFSSQIGRPSRPEPSTSSAVIPIRWTIARVKPGKRRENSNGPS